MSFGNMREMTDRTDRYIPASAIRLATEDIRLAADLFFSLLRYSDTYSANARTLFDLLPYRGSLVLNDFTISLDGLRVLYDAQMFEHPYDEIISEVLDHPVTA